jgi:flagellar biosynthesis/type III secretory pathway protein FliH
VDEPFVSLASFLRVAPVLRPATGVACTPAAAPTPNVVRGIVDFAHADVVHELALMRLAAYETFEQNARRMLRTLARDVLGRELSIAPADLDALAAEALAAFAGADPVSLRVSAADAERVRSPLPVSIDPALEVGDLVVDVRDGAFESRFTFRLEAALERAERAP